MDNTLCKQPVGISKSEMPTQRWAFSFFQNPGVTFKKISHDTQKILGWVS
jgi:hypothetical protein